MQGAAIKEAFGFISTWCRRSADHALRQQKLWNLLSDLYQNRRPLSAWDNDYFAPDTAPDVASGWKSQQVIATSPIVDNYTENLLQPIIGTENYFLVEPAPTGDVSIEDPTYSTAEKLQILLLNSCRLNQFSIRLYEYLQQATLYGTAAAKTFLTDAGPCLQSIPLLQFLADPYAPNCDVNQWSGVGDRSWIPRLEAMSRFREAGPYTLGREEAQSKFGKGGAPIPEKFAERGNERRYLMYPDGDYLQAWDWHGVWLLENYEPREVVATIISDAGVDDPSGGVLVRLEPGPLFQAGRPYVVSHYTPKAGPYGEGMVRPNLDIIYQLSSLLNLFLDNVRFQSNQMLAVKRSSSGMVTDLQNAEEGDRVFPGKIWYYEDDPKEIMPIAFNSLDLGILLTAIQWLERQLETRTSVSDATRGVGQTEKTATEFAGLLQQSQKPVGTRLLLLRDSLLQPFADRALEMIQRTAPPGITTWAQDATGKSVPVTFMPGELESGTYTARPNMVTNMQAKIGAAQTLQQLVPILQGLNVQLLATESTAVNFTGILTQISHLLSVQDADQLIVRNLPPEERDRILMGIMAPQSVIAPPPMSGGPPVPGETPPPGAGTIDTEGPSDINGGPSEMQTDLQADTPGNNVAR